MPCEWSEPVSSGELNATTVHGAGCRLHATRCLKMATDEESATPCHVFSGALTLNEFVILYRWNSCLARNGISQEFAILTCCSSRWWWIYVMVGTFFAGGRRDRFLATVHHCPTARSQRRHLTRPGIKKKRQITPLLNSSPSCRTAYHGWRWQAPQRGFYMLHHRRCSVGFFIC